MATTFRKPAAIWRWFAVAGLLSAIADCGTQKAALSQQSNAYLGPVLSVAELTKDKEKYDGKTVRVRGYVGMTIGQLALMDLGRDGCILNGWPGLLIDLRTRYQERLDHFHWQVVVVEGQFRNDLFPVKKDVVFGRAVGNDEYVGPLLNPTVVTVLTEECKEGVKQPDR